jgi:hypothetical protein
MWVFQG